MNDRDRATGEQGGSPPLGKVDRDFFREEIAPRLGAEREDVPLGPTHGVDFGVVDVNGAALVTATDPLSILPALGWERAGRFALDVAMADVAVSGVSPTHLAVTFTLPPGMSDEAFASVWAAMDREASDLGASIVTGHTARYADCSFPWVGAATVMGVGDHDDVVRPDGARPGDSLLVTKGPAVETAGLFATLFPEGLAARGVSGACVDAAQARIDEASCVRDALTAVAAGPVTAMHDATEGGLRGALCEMAESAGVEFDVDPGAVPTRPGVEAVCEALSVDPWDCTTSGTLVVAVDPTGAEGVVDALEARATPAAVVGEVTEGTGVYFDGERQRHPGTDPSWAAYERLAREAAE
jgi:hydrogenase maturation factor